MPTYYSSEFEYMRRKYNYRRARVAVTGSLPVSKPIVSAGTGPLSTRPTDTDSLRAVKPTRVAVTGSLPLSKPIVSAGTGPLSISKPAMATNEWNNSLTSSLALIALGVWKPLKEMPSKTRCACIVLLIIGQLALSAIIVALMGLLLNILGLVYLILAITTSYIAFEVWRQANDPSNSSTRY